MIGSLSLTEWTGLVTATGISATFGLSIYVWLRHQRPSRKVKAGLDDGRPYIIVTFINERGPDVVVAEVGFECDDGTARPRSANGVYGPLDFDLQPPLIHQAAERYGRGVRSVPAGQSVRLYFHLGGLRRDIEEKRYPFPLRAYCKDETDKVYRSRNLRWDVTCALGEHDPTLPGPTVQQ